VCVCVCGGGGAPGSRLCTSCPHCRLRTASYLCKPHNASPTVLHQDPACRRQRHLIARLLLQRWQPSERVRKGGRTHRRSRTRTVSALMSLLAAQSRAPHTTYHQTPHSCFEHAALLVCFLHLCEFPLPKGKLSYAGLQGRTGLLIVGHALAQAPKPAHAAAVRRQAEQTGDTI
jgi:hypothetical protein